MNVLPKTVTIEEVVEGYTDNGEGGVKGYGGRLTIRPSFQREFVYGEDRQKAVVETVLMGGPLNAMYWGVVDGGWELIDGQQRTLSLTRYVTGEFSIDGRFFQNLTRNEQRKILDHRLMVFECEGTEKERLDWFKRINVAGLALKPQEIRNSVYAGPWLESAKRWFSRKNGPSAEVGRKYLEGSPERQDHLETAIEWMRLREKEKNIEEHMGRNQHEESADPLWKHFVTVIEWVEKTFPEYYRRMKGVDWGRLYLEHGYRTDLDPKQLEVVVAHLVSHPDVKRRKGIWEYALHPEDETVLDVRTFTEEEKRVMYKRQEGICAIDKVWVPYEGMEADHIIPWSKGGRTMLENGQMVSRRANRRKGAR